MTIHAVICDLDGTLTDTLEDIADYTNRSLQDYGFPPHPADSYKKMVGNGMNMLIRRALPVEVVDDAVIRQVEERMMEYYRSNPVGKTVLYPGIPGLLTWLNDNRIPVSVLSNKSHELVIPVARQLLSSWTFTHVWGASDRFPKKPDPAAARALCTDMGADPGFTLFLGDSDVDMETARAAGMIAAGALWGFRSREELIEAGADSVVERPEKMKELIHGE